MGAVGRLWASSLALDVALVGGVALVLGLLRLDAPSLWVDEAFTARAVNLPLPELVDRQYHVLYYSLLKPWTAVAGTSEWALRLPSVLGAMLSCGLLVVLARGLFDRRVAVASGLLLASSPFVVKWAQQARGYTLGLAISLLATLLLVRALDRGTRLAWAAYGFLFAALVVWHPVSGLLLVLPHAVLIGQQRERLLPHGLLAALLIGVLAAPWAAVVAMRSTGEGVAMNWLEFPRPGVAARALLGVSGLAGLGVLLAIVGLLVLRRTGRRPLAVWLGAWAVTPFALALLVSLARPIYLDRYLLVAAPAFALLAGIAITRVGTSLRVVLVAVAVIATSVGLARWYSTGGDGNWRGEDWRRATATVLARRGESEPILVAQWWGNFAAEYYGAEVVDVSTADSIWVLTWSESGDDISASERAALGFGEHRLVERLPFGHRVSAQLWKR